VPPVFEAALPSILALLPLLPPLLLWWRGRGYRSVALHWLLLQVLGGGAVATFVFYVDGLTAMVLTSSAAPGSSETLDSLRVLWLGAPFSQTLLVLVVLPLRRRRLLAGPRDGMLCALGAGSGYCAAETLVLLLQPDAVGLSLAHALLAMPAGLFCTGLWGFFLGPRPGFRWSRFALAWLVAVLLEGLYDHVLFHRGPGFLVALLPLLAVISVGTYAGLSSRSGCDLLPPSGRKSLLTQLPHTPTLSEVTAALNPRGHRLMISWTVLGVLVVFGVTLSALGAAVYLGNRLGIDFTHADEADLHANSPLLLLGSAVLVAFPVAGYLIARASGSESVLETAIASGLAILAAAALLSMTEPLAVVFVLAVAPVAFSLACAGAWLASRQQRQRSNGDQPPS